MIFQPPTMLFLERHVVAKKNDGDFDHSIFSSSADYLVGTS
jgi:hypothetical protein